MREFSRILKKANEEQSKIKRRLLIIGYLSKLMEKKCLKPPIIVGGSAVMFYTLEHYITYDIDLVCENRKELENMLRKCGFERAGRHWILPPIELAIEIPSTKLEDESYDRVREVRIDGYGVRILGIEDIILDRLRAYKYWRSEIDRDQAIMMVAGNIDDIDWGYLRSRAKRDQLEIDLMEVRKIAKSALRKRKIR